MDRPYLDIVSRTLAFAAMFAWLLLARSMPLVLAAAAIALVSALVVRAPFSLILAAILAPALPVIISHLGIEPLFSGAPISESVVLRAADVWLRLAGMALLSVAWISSLDIVGSAQLCRLFVLGQFLLVPLVTASTFLRTTTDRWLAIRELHALRRRGSLRRRTRIPMREIPGVGIQLTMASLVSASELALSCQGRGIGSRRYLAVPLPRVSALGLILSSVLVAAAAAIILMG